MDTTQMMLASGGILSLLIPLMMMLLPLILLLIAWRILKSTATTAQQVTRLTEQMDELLRHLEEGTLTTPGAVAFTMEPAPDDAEQQDDFDFLAATATTGEDHLDDQLETTDEPGQSADPFADASEDEETGFEFPGAEDEDFGEFDDRDETIEPAAAGSDAEEAFTSDDDAYDAREFSFDMDEQMPGGETFSDSEPEASEPSRETDLFTEQPLETPESPADALAGFGAASDQAADESSESTEEDLREEQGGDSTLPAAEEAPEDSAEADSAVEPPAAAEEASEESAEAGSVEEPHAAVVEEPPAIVQLEDDPARPEVSLARCGQCGHKLAYKKTLAGKKARCPSCKGAFVLP